MKNSKENFFNKLDKITSKEPSKWLEKAQWRAENEAWLKGSQDIALNVLLALKAKNMTQRQLAEILSVSPQQVNKIVKGEENLTLETIFKLESALDIKVIYKCQLAFEQLNLKNKPHKTTKLPYNKLKHTPKKINIKAGKWVSSGNLSKSKVFDFDSLSSETFTPPSLLKVA